MSEFEKLLVFIQYLLGNLSSPTYDSIMQGECSGDIVLDVKGCQVFMHLGCEFLIKFNQTIKRPERCVLFDLMKSPNAPIEVRKAASCDIRKVVKSIEDYAYMNYPMCDNKKLLEQTDKVREKINELDKDIYSNYRHSA